MLRLLFPLWKEKAEDTFPLLKTCSLANTGQTLIYLPKRWHVSNFPWLNSSIHMLGFLNKGECSWPLFPALKQMLHFQYIAEPPCCQISHFCPNSLNWSCNLRWCMCLLCKYQLQKGKMSQIRIWCMSSYADLCQMSIWPQKMLDPKPLFMCYGKITQILFSWYGYVQQIL